MEDLRFVFFTNEKNIDFLSLTLKYFLKHVKENEKISVILNKITKTDLPYEDKVEYMNANVDFDDHGKHFGKSIFKVASQFKEKYLFFFLDDYFLIKDINNNHLNSVIDMMNIENVDCFSFEYRGGEESVNTIPFNTNDDYLKEKLFMKTNQNRYLYSLQPSIWKRDSLVKICGENEFSLHEMDETREDIRQKNYLKCLNNSFDSFFNHIDVEDKEYFVIAYCELTRHGVFPTSENGFGMSEDEPLVKLIRKIIKEEDLTNKPEFFNKLANIK
jgi:hypothetical protein